MDRAFVNWLNEQEQWSMWAELGYLDGKRGGPGEIMEKIYLGKATTSMDGMTILITDFVSLWTESIGQDDIGKRMKEMNPNLEADPEGMLKEIGEIVLGRRQYVSVDVKYETMSRKTMRIKFKTTFERLPLHWYCILQKAESEEFHTEIVRPLMLALLHYQRRESALFDVLAIKDQELDQNRLISRSQTREQKSCSVSTMDKFQSRVWSVDDLRSKAFIRTQRRSKLDNLARAVVSNEMFNLVCRANVYIEEQPEPSADDDERESVEGGETSGASLPQRTDSTSSTNSKSQEPITSQSTADPIQPVIPDPAPPQAPPTRQRKQKRLRL